jgi:Flp pilus assembly protein TadB
MPGVDGLLAAFLGAGLGLGVLCIGLYARGLQVSPTRAPIAWRRLLTALRTPAMSGRLAGAVLAGVSILVVTHWIVAALGAAALVACWPLLFGGARAEQRQIRQLEALVLWTESLRDTVTARASLEQAVPATAYTAPLLIRPALVRILGLLRARVPLDSALLALSAELRDASADKVIGALILNTRQCGTGLAEVLTAVASSARAELDQRRQITAGRASVRRSVQVVVVITIVFAVFLVVFSRAYMKPYDSSGGQLALAVVIALFALGFFWLRRLAGAEAAPPFLHRPDERLPDRDVQVLRQLTTAERDDAP